MNSTREQAVPGVSPIYVFDEYRLDSRRRIIFAPDGKPLPLTPRVLDTLIYLVQHPCTLLGRDSLMDSIWPDSAVEPNNLSQNIAKLRRLFGERPGENRFIETVPGRGYRFIAEVRAVSAAAGIADEQTDGSRSLDEETEQLFRQALRRLQRPTAENCRLAVANLKQCVERNSRFAPAWAWLADAHLFAVNVGHASPDRLVEAERLAHHALELDPRSATAHAVIGTIDTHHGNWLAAESRLMTAVALDARDFMPRTLHASFVLMHAGHLRRAISQLRQTFKLAPDDPRMLLNLAMAHSIAGDDAEALSCARLATSFGFPEDTVLLPFVFAHAASRAGRQAEAAAYAARLFAPMADGGRLVTAVFRGLEDRKLRDKALRALDELRNRALEMPGSGMAVLLVAEWLTRLGALDLAFGALNFALERDAEVHSRRPNWQTLWVPELAALRRDARFQPLAERLGLTQYWRMFGPPDC